MMGIHWQAFQNFQGADGDSYANRGMNKLSRVRPTHQALPGLLLSQIPFLDFSLGFTTLPLITVFLPSVPHLHTSFNFSTCSLPLHTLFTSLSFAKELYRDLQMEHYKKSVPLPVTGVDS